MMDRLIGQLLGKSLRARLLQSTAAVLASEAYSNVLRLALNLVIARLLYPEAFGLMLMVNLVSMVLNQLSDVGIRVAVIARVGEVDDSFLNAVWTVSIVRGLVLGALTAVLAYPVSVFYAEPRLFPLILLTSATPILQSLGSPRQLVYEKRVEMWRPILAGTVCNTVTAVVVVAWLLIKPSIWALAANGLIGAVLGAIGSYVFFPGPMHRFHWDGKAVRELVQFGRWVVVATALSFLSRQGDSLIVSKAVSAAQLGTFSIAMGLSKVVDQVVSRLNWSVLVPAYSELSQNDQDGAGHERARKIKLGMFALSAPLVIVLGVFGRDLIRLIYDARYYDAGWILEFLAVGALFFAVGAPLRALPMARGDSYRYMWQQVATVIVLCGAMAAGAALRGFHGLIAGIAVANALEYCVVRLSVRKYRVGDLRTDLLFAGGMLAIIVCAWAIRGWPSPS